MPPQLIFLTFLTMIAFAANSIFSRLALVDPANDPVSFTLVRLAAGALVLLLFFLKYRKSVNIVRDRNFWLAPAALFTYALFFSLSYVQIGAGTGALILFASVQLTMMTVAIFRGHKLNPNEKIGFILAAVGFIYLLLPGLNMPPPVGAGLMGVAGVAWGIYSLIGQGATNPIMSTATNFLLTIPLVGLIFLFHPMTLTSQGIILAILSGAITSGLGYVLWYFVLKKFQTSTAAIIQLSVPALAAVGGVVFLSESLNLRLIIASALIILGIVIKIKASHFKK